MSRAFEECGIFQYEGKHGFYLYDVEIKRAEITDDVDSVENFTDMDLSIFFKDVPTLEEFERKVKLIDEMNPWTFHDPMKYYMLPEREYQEELIDLISNIIDDINNSDNYKDVFLRVKERRDRFIEHQRRKQPRIKTFHIDYRKGNQRKGD